LKVEVMNTAEIREFRLLLREYFDANRVDWSPEILDPIVVRILVFVETHSGFRSEIEELLAFLFIDADPGLEELFAELVPRFGFSDLRQEIVELGERRPRLFRSGHVLRLLEPFDGETEV
jgi:hypothetical protein